MKKVLVVDNDDSFVYNIVEMLRPYAYMDVVNHSAVADTDLYDAILLSPGAGLPCDYPLMDRLIARCAITHPIFGVCLGHQAIATHYGAKLKRLDTPLHGYENSLQTALCGVTTVGCYNSWVVDESTIGGDLVVTSADISGNVMSLRHRQLQICGVQFHPESIITLGGAAIFSHWLSYGEL